MKLLSRLLPYMTAIFVLLLITLLAWNCVDIFFFTPATPTSTYTYENVAARLESLLPLTGICIFLMLITVWFQDGQTETSHRNSSKIQHKEACIKATVPFRPLQLIRTVLLLLAGIFIIWGVFNSGLCDVFVKAINICTECIGLG